MTNSTQLTPYIGFKTTEALRGKLNRFLEAVEANDKTAGSLYIEFIGELTEHVIDTLLLKMVEIAEINKVGQKVIRFCASSSTKVSGMLTSKIYKKMPVKELLPVANLWTKFLKNSQTDNHGEWYLLTPISNEFGQDLDAILAEKGGSSEFAPNDLNDVMQKYDQLMQIIIDTFFLEATKVVKIGAITNKMLTVGVDTVEKAVNAVLEKVIKPLEPSHFGKFVEHTENFYIRL
ncbi:hypothetical protein A9Q81_18465 [Gammaproteobacteria bacterium 42_54_T18]|nr:hypothetical protein A9Q81_18465 [Gammaproteobacteria bacterium 42_54_T18]